MSDYEFHTVEVEGEEVAGILFSLSTGRFYEFQDPDTHDDYARYEDPRTGAIVTYNGPLQRALKKTVAGHMRSRVNADEWAEFRQMYVDSDDDDFEAWADEWEEIHKEKQRETQAQ